MVEKIRPSAETDFDQEFNDEKTVKQEKQLRQNAAEALKKHSEESKRASQEVESAFESAPQQEKKKARERKPAPAKGIKAQQYKVTMRHVESKLPSYQKAFSKIINNQAVETVSNIAGKTIARPSGLAGGAVAAFVGLIVLYVNAKRIGFSYNGGSAIIFFISVGWIAGILIEYLVGAIKRLSSKN